MYILVGGGMTLGGFLPVLFGQSALGGWSVLGSFIGGILGIYLYVKIK